MRTREQEVEPLVNLSEITEIELLTLKVMQELAMGEHRSPYHGPGFDFVGLRDWQAGDRFPSIDWPQSTLTGFNPIVVREFEQPGTAPVIVVADRSASTRCGVNGIPIAAAIARAVATIGMSAVFCQDMFGLMTFDTGFQNVTAVPSRVGKSQVIHCLDAYQHGRGVQEVRQAGSINMTIAGFLRRTSLVPVISDFLFDEPEDMLRELSELRSDHDAFIVLVDSAFAFELPRVSAGWIQTVDVETGRTRVLSRTALRALPRRVRDWQDDVERIAKDFDLEVLRFEIDQARSDVALAQFVAERRLRKR